MNHNLDFIRDDTDKAFVSLEHVLSAYFDSGKPNLQAIAYDFPRIRTHLYITLDYLQNIMDSVTERE